MQKLFIALFVKSRSIYINKRPKSPSANFIHISTITFHQWKCAIFVIFVCLSVCLSRTSHTFRSLRIGTL